MKKIEFGIKIPTLSEEGGKGTKFVTEINNFIQEIDSEYNALWISDHLMPWVKRQRLDADTLECWTTMSYLAGAFKHFTIGSAVLCNSFRSPMLLAKMGATLSDLSNGKFILGIGAGWNEQEYLAYGYPFPSAATRIRQLEEAVQIIRKMWTEDEVFFRGKYYTVTGARCFPRPSPLPPLMIGGSGEKLTLRVVAKYADWWNGHATSIQNLEHKIKVLKSHCARVGRNFDDIKKTVEAFVAIAHTRDEAQKIAARGRNAHFRGTPEDVLSQIKGFVNLGMNYYILRFLDQPSVKGANLFAKTVIPDL